MIWCRLPERLSVLLLQAGPTLARPQCEQEEYPGYRESPTRELWEATEQASSVSAKSLVCVYCSQVLSSTDVCVRAPLGASTWVWSEQGLMTDVTIYWSF